MFSFDAHQPFFPEIISLHGRWLRDRDALVCGDTRLDWPAFSAAVQQFGAALNREGIGRGDRVVVLMDNGIPMAISLFGIMAAGAVSVPINLSVTRDSLAAMIDDAGANAVIVTSDQQSRIDAILPFKNARDTLCVTTGDAVNDWRSWDELLAIGTADIALPEIMANDQLNIIYSSGTTGVPKGIVHTHLGRLNWASDLAMALHYHPGARTLLTIGLYSNISWVGMLCTLLVGGTMVIEERFDAERTLDTIVREQITNMAMVPIQYQRLVESYQHQPRQLASLIGVMSCGSPLQPALKQALFELVSCGVIELYGLTEGVITTLQPSEAEGRWASVGRPLPGTDLKIVDADGVELPAGESGEIVSRGRITMTGYLNREQSNLEAAWQDDNGSYWLRTGDIGRVDEQGYLFIVDRKKDLILSGGQNIYPQDIEAIVSTHDAVDDVAVIPALSERWGETPVALVVPRREGVDVAEILDWCNERLGKQQRIAEVIFIDELPRNPNGKILKRQLRERFRDLRF